MDYGLTGRRCVVTGASRGIGRAIAQVLAREGGRAALVARDEAALTETRELIVAAGGEAAVVVADLSDLGVAEGLAARTTAALGGAPEVIALSHAYMTPLSKVHQVDLEVAARVLDTDVRACLAVLKGVTPELMGARWGRIVVVGSRLGRMGQPKSPINSIVKAALEGLVKNLAIDLGRFGITANLVAPGFVDNERLAERHPNPGDLERLARAASTKRLATVEDVAEVVAFLASTAARQITGAVVPIDGGLHLGHLL
jgi:NAD(P)-dependent dehydrogenase (short-subunit alcohol dehydrogenase family)